MHNHSYKFNFMVTWCVLLSIAVVIMVAMIAVKSNQKEPCDKENEKGDSAHTAHAYLTGSGQRSVDYIQLVWENGTSLWKHSVLCFCENTSLILQRDSVKITTGGFYHTYAQVAFWEKKEWTVTLVANELVAGKTRRKLIEAESTNTIMSMTGVFRLRNGDRVKLNIPPESKILQDPSKTYWGLFLLAKDI